MANDLYTMTPGSAVADELQDILARKRMESRQQMLDQLTSAKTASDIHRQTEDAAALKDQREAVSEWRKAQAAAANEKSKQHQTLMDALNSFDASELSGSDLQAFNLAKATGDENLVKALVTNMTKQPKPEKEWMPVYDPKGNDTGNWAPQGAHFLTNPPQPNQASMPQLFQTQVPDPEHPGQLMNVSHWLKPGEMPNDKNKINAATFKGNGLKLPGQKGLYDEKIFARYQTTVKSPNSTAQARAMALNDVINSIGDPMVKQDVSAILNNQQASVMPVEDMITKGVLTGDPQHIENVKAVLSAFRGRQ